MYTLHKIVTIGAFINWILNTCIKLGVIGLIGLSGMFLLQILGFIILV